MIRLNADFNNVTADGRLKCEVTRADMPLTPNTLVLAHDGLENQTVIGYLDTFDPDRGVAILRVDWSQLDRIGANRVDVTHGHAAVIVGTFDPKSIVSVAANAKRTSFAITA